MMDHLLLKEVLQRLLVTARTDGSVHLLRGCVVRLLLSLDKVLKVGLTQWSLPSRGPRAGTSSTSCWPGDKALPDRGLRRNAISA